MCREQISDLRICKGFEIIIMNAPAFIISQYLTKINTDR